MPGISNNEIKRVRSLSQKKFRDELGLFIVEGEKMVSEAMNSRFVVEKVYRTEDIGREAMSRISALSSPSPALAVLRKPSDTDLSAGEVSSVVKGKGLYLALDTIKDPGNLGTILRIADWFGIDGVFASRGTVDIYNPKTIQATMGAVFRVNFHYTDLKVLLEGILSAGGKVYGTFLDGRNIYGCRLETGAVSPAVIVIGNESEGISEEIAGLVSDRLFIPPYPEDDPGSESLNAAVATAVTVAEFRRRAVSAE